MERPWFVVRSEDVPENESAYPPPFDGEKLSLGRDLGTAAGSRSLGVWRERLLPGRRTSFTHAHLVEEELVYVLAGRPSVRWVEPGAEPREWELAPGDLVSFPSGTGIAHVMVNRSDADAELLVVGERSATERVWYAEDDAFAAWYHTRGEHKPWTDVAGPTGVAKWPPARIETPRLTIRPWEPRDAQALAEAQAANQAHLAPWMPWASELPTLDELLGRIAGWQRGHDAVLGVFGQDRRVVGGTGIHDRVGELGRELGYWVAGREQGKGYVTEWCAALCAVCFGGLEIDRIEIRCDPDNVRSAAVAHRLGFRLEATLPRRALGSDGRPRDSQVWCLYRDQWPDSPGAAVPVRAFDAAGRRLV
ncbi:MAG: GNAT family N-acetyltransferase [Myxococcota bacterium]